MSLIETVHKLKRRFFRTVDLDRIPLINSVRRHLISKTKTNVVDNINGHRMYLDPIDSLGISWHKTFEPTETAYFQQHVKPGDVVVDIGANIGYFTLLFAKLVGPQGKVFAFEPDDANYALLEKNVRENGYNNVVLVKKAISDKNGALKLFLNPENFGDHRAYDSNDGRAFIEIPCVTLDSYLADFKRPISTLKMDIQGGEYLALKGMHQTVSNNPNLTFVTEFWPGGLRRCCGIEGKDYIELLHSHGFEIQEIDEKTQKIIPVNFDELLHRFTDDTTDFANLLCRKKK